jgi:thiamine biosynthesis protein ThiI
MKIIIRPFSEIMIKSKPVRKRYLKILQTNIAKHLKQIDENIKTHLFYDKLEVSLLETPFSGETKGINIKFEEVIEKLKFIPGIESFVVVDSFDLDKKLLEKEDNKEIFEFIFKQTKKYFLEKIENKSFVVRVKRS